MFVQKFLNMITIGLSEVLHRSENVSDFLLKVGLSLSATASFFYL